MNAQNEAPIEVSFPRALVLSAISMACFVVGLFVIGVPMRDPLLIGFLIVMTLGMTFGFAMCFYFMFRCRISRAGLCPAVPTFYQSVLRWEDIVAVRTTSSGGLFYVIRGRGIGEFRVLPRRFLLKDPESLDRLIGQYAPAENIVRRKLLGE